MGSPGRCREKKLGMFDAVTYLHYRDAGQSVANAVANGGISERQAREEVDRRGREERESKPLRSLWEGK